MLHRQKAQRWLIWVSTIFTIWMAWGFQETPQTNLFLSLLQLCARLLFIQMICLSLVLFADAKETPSP